MIKKIKQKKARGFSIIEVLIAITITSVIGTVSVLSFLNWQSEKKVQIGADTVLATLKEARSLTLNGKGEFAYGVYFGEIDKAIVFKGESYDPNLIVSTNSLPSGVVISTSTLGTSITFQKFSGKTNGNGMVIVGDVSNASTTRTINIELTGGLSTK